MDYFDEDELDGVPYGFDSQKQYDDFIAEQKLLDDYNKLLRDRARKTAQIVNLESRNAVGRFSDRIRKLDQERAEVHRELETAGRKLTKSKTDVLGDIVLNELGEERLSIPGITAYPVLAKSGEKYVHNEHDIDPDELGDYERGLLLAFSSESRLYAWQSEINTNVTNTPEFNAWLDDKVNALLDSSQTLQEKFGLNLRSYTIDHSGVSHMDVTHNNGIYVPNEIVRLFVSKMRDGRAWFSRDELKDHQETKQKTSVDYYDDRSYESDSKFLFILARQLKSHLSEDQYRELIDMTDSMPRPKSEGREDGLFDQRKSSSFTLYEKSNGVRVNLSLELHRGKPFVINADSAEDFVSKFEGVAREYREAVEEAQRELSEGKEHRQEDFEEERTIARLEAKRPRGKFKK